MSITNEVKRILGSTLSLGPRVAGFAERTQLLGAVPELDSMAVVTVITALEDHFGFIVDDDEINAETFETLGSLSRFVEHKLALA